ncbi:MAG: hypothetical protein J7M40_05305, partial [Planctomycetes bacterium]|nr:hypothetical protein [Planctomycetota bacterium]
SQDEKYRAVSKLTTGILTVIGCVVMVIVVNRVISDLRNLQSWDTFRSIMLAPSLSMLLTPFIYVVVLVSKYELVFMRLSFGIKKSKRLKRYARRRIIMHARLNLKRVQYLLTSHPVDLMQIQNETDVERLFENNTR